MDRPFLWLGCLWAAWCVANLLCMALIPLPRPAHTGFRLHMPESLRAVLTPTEWEAVRMHELGHAWHWHPWQCFFWTCMFCRLPKHKRELMEFQADDYAADRGHALALSTAIRKLSNDKFDRWRSKRLFDIWWDHETSK